MKPLRSFLVLILAIGVPLCALGNVVTIHFDEFGTATPIPVSDISIDGVTLDFSGGSATYNGLIGTDGTTQFLSDPVLTGDSLGALQLTFEDATPILSFDVALQTIAPLDFGYHVDLSSLGTIVLSQDYATNPLVLYSEGQFSYSGLPVDTAIITFYNGPDPFGTTNVTTFAFDNLTFDSQVAPEPGTVILMLGGLVPLVISGRRRIRSALK